MTFAVYNRGILQVLPGVMEELGLVPGQEVTDEEVKMIMTSNLMKMLEVMNSPKIKSEYFPRRLPIIQNEEIDSLISGLESSGLPGLGNHGYPNREELLKAVKFATIGMPLYLTNVIPSLLPDPNLVGHRIPLDLYAGKGLIQSTD